VISQVAIRNFTLSLGVGMVHNKKWDFVELTTIMFGLSCTVDCVRASTPYCLLSKIYTPQYGHWCSIEIAVAPAKAHSLVA